VAAAIVLVAAVGGEEEEGAAAVTAVAAAQNAKHRSSVAGVDAGVVPPTKPARRAVEAARLLPLAINPRIVITAE
jgi:hypothetical protein